MRVDLKLGKLKNANRLRNQFQEMVSQSLAKFESSIREVQLALDDVNGPRGGIDKYCRAVISLEGASPIVIDDRDSSPGRLVNRVLSRAAQNLREQTNRRGHKAFNRGQRSRLRRVHQTDSELS
ncbi:MAG: hypothetical protein AAF664_03080 [Planctomycetota bacterium]